MTQAFHYFGSTAFNWATGATRQEVIDSLAKRATAAMIPKDGLYCWTCRVMVPAGTDYEINFFQPQGVKIEDGQEVHIRSVKGYVTMIERRAPVQESE